MGQSLKEQIVESLRAGSTERVVAKLQASYPPPRCGDIWRERRSGRGGLPPRYVVVTCVLRRQVEIVSVEFVDHQRGDGRWMRRAGAPHRRAALERFNGRGSGYELHLASEPELFPHEGAIP